MKFFKFSVLIAVCGAALTGAALFWTSQNVQRAESELRALKDDIAHEEQSIRVLRAEWDYLNTPERLEEMATHYLEMTPQEAATIAVDPARLPDPFIPALPSRKPIYDGMMAQPVSVRPSSAVHKPVPPRTVRPNPRRDDDFRALLDNINKGGE